MSSIDQLAKDLYKTMSEADNNKVKPYDTKAEVLRTEGNIVWVKIPGGVDETPVAKTNNANDGDQVMVRVAGGRAWILGNETSPATDDTMASIAYDIGVGASTAASRAIEEAGRALNAADSAEIDAQRAKEVADGVERTAKGAEIAADTAYSNLAQVQSVLEVAEWIANHGAYTKANTYNPQTTYYTVDPTIVLTPSDSDVDSNGILIYYELHNGIYVRTSRNKCATEVETPIEEHINIYYELINGKYVKTEDSSIDPNKTYYTLDETFYLVTGSPVAQPNPESLDEYYTLTVENAMANYIKSHLALTNDGLYVMTDNDEWKVLISNNGVYILDRNNNHKAEYRDIIKIGQNDNNIIIDSNGLSIYKENILKAIISDTIRLGRDDASHIDITENNLEFFEDGTHRTGLIRYGEPILVTYNDLLTNLNGLFLSTYISRTSVLNDTPKSDTASFYYTINNEPFFIDFDPLVDGTYTNGDVTFTYSAESKNVEFVYDGRSSSPRIEHTFKVPLNNPYPLDDIFVQAPSERASNIANDKKSLTFSIKQSLQIGTPITIYYANDYDNPEKTITFTAGTSGSVRVNAAVMSGDYRYYDIVYNAQTNAISVNYVSDVQGAYVHLYYLVFYGFNAYYVGAEIKSCYAAYETEVTNPVYMFGDSRFLDGAERYSYLFGEGLISNRNNCFYVGRFNKYHEKSLFCVGNGTGYADQMNCMDVTDSGDILLYAPYSSIYVADKLGQRIHNFGWDDELYTDSESNQISLKTLLDKMLSHLKGFENYNFTYNSGFAAYDTSGVNRPVAVYYGGVVNLCGAIRTTAAQSSTGQKIMGYVPSGLEPVREQHFLQQGSGVARYQLIIRTDGAIIADRYGTTSDTALSSGLWLNIGCTYICRANYTI